MHNLLANWSVADSCIIFMFQKARLACCCAHLQWTLLIIACCDMAEHLQVDFEDLHKPLDEENIKVMWKQAACVSLCPANCFLLFLLIYSFQ